MWQGWISGIIGLWLIVSGIIGKGLEAQWNYLIAGIVLAVLGAWTYKHWQSILTGLGGIWLIISGLVASLMAPVNLIIVGLIVAVLGFWESLVGKRTQVKAA